MGHYAAEMMGEPTARQKKKQEESARVEALRNEIAVYGLVGFTAKDLVPLLRLFGFKSDEFKISRIEAVEILESKMKKLRGKRIG